MISLNSEEINLLGKSFVEVGKHLLGKKLSQHFLHSSPCYVGLKGCHIGLDQGNMCINRQQSG